MQIPLMRGDKIEGVEWRDSLPVNMYAVNRPVMGAQGFMLQLYGIRQHAIGGGKDRGAKYVTRSGLEGQYRVSGQSLYKVLPSGELLDLGTIPGSNEVSMDFSFNNLAIVADKKLYYYNSTDGLRQITDEQIGDPIDIVWVDGYFFLTDGEDIYHSDIANEEEYEPLAFGNAQFSPDPSFGLGKNASNEVIVFGKDSVEYFVNVGTVPFAFQRVQRKAQKIGILGTHCKKELANNWFTISRRIETSPSFHVVSLGQEQTIGTRETDKILATYTEQELSEATIDTMMIDGIAMAIFHLKRHCFMFNQTVAADMGVKDAWTILKSDVEGDTVYRAKNPIRDESGQWIVGDNQGSRIGVIDETLSTQYDNITEWIMYTPFVPAETLSINELELQTTPGVAVDNDATVAVSLSVNGRTYDREYWNLYGVNFDYDHRFILRNMGYVREYFSMKFRGASRSRMSFAKCEVDLS
jgi:hypothetical protein